MHPLNPRIAQPFILGTLLPLPHPFMDTLLLRAIRIALGIENTRSGGKDG
jgi:hypothetical protein